MRNYGENISNQAAYTVAKIAESETLTLKEVTFCLLAIYLIVSTSIVNDITFQFINSSASA